MKIPYRIMIADAQHTNQGYFFPRDTKVGAVSFGEVFGIRMCF